ncbi:MAG: TonB-dependent receptor plug domain-containing protein, partial [Parvularculaceae bacterium]
MKTNGVRTLLLLGVAALLIPAGALAQQEADEDESAQQTDDVIIVTGTSAARSEFNTPQSVNQFDEVEIRKFTSNSQADILTQLPGVSAEGGGGEVATNFFVRGLPSGGQFQFTPLEYDGIPAFTTFGLNSSAFDVYYRNDLGIDRLEYVTGGVSNLFGPGSVAGIINYISKTGGPENEGTAQIEWSNRGRFRGDIYSSGPLGGPDTNTFYAVSGYYREDEGPLDSGLDTEGFQLRGNLKREFADGSGSFTLYGQAIDDRVQFFLPLPLDGDSRERVRGNDGKVVFTANTAEAGQLRFATPDGVFESPIEDGVETQGGSIAAVLDKDLGDGWGLNVKAKYARYDHSFNLFLDGDGVVNLPETLGDFLDNRGLGDIS